HDALPLCTYGHPAHFNSNGEKVGEIMDFDDLLGGGGAAGMSCALLLGSAKGRPYTIGKRTGIIHHQRTSHLQSAVFYNVLGLSPGTPGAKILKDGPGHLKEIYPHVEQIAREKVTEIQVRDDGFQV